MEKNLNLTGRLLSHTELSRQPEKGKNGNDNEAFFRADFLTHVIDKYKGTAVLYWKGILCGYGPNARELAEKASRYYGSSNLTAYVVPADAEGLDKAVESAYFPKI
jgi:hypothetical protein